MIHPPANTTSKAAHLVRLASRVGPALVVSLATVAALASLSGSDTVQRAAGACWFVGAAVLAGLAALVAAAVLLGQRRPAAALPHIGFVLGLASVILSQNGRPGGYLFLPAQGGGRDYCLSQDRTRLIEQPLRVVLDSVGTRHRRGFRPGPVAFVRGSAGRQQLTASLAYNRTLACAGYRLALSRVVAAGFLDEYELVVDSSEFLLLHNQRIVPRPGLDVWSFDFDAEQQKVGLLVNRTRQWLSVGDSATVEGAWLKLTAASFTPTPGAIFSVADVRLRPVLFIGFALMLAGLVLVLGRKEGP
jgi:hypothetical protein